MLLVAEEEEEEEGQYVVKGRVEIDTRRPFTSVREAVALFGEKILARQIYGNNLKQTIKQSDGVNKINSKFNVAVTTASEVEETTKEEVNAMSSVRQESYLEQTKREIGIVSCNLINKPDIVGNNFVHGIEKKKCVNFASPPINESGKSKWKMRKKTFVPFIIGGLFLKNKQSNNK